MKPTVLAFLIAVTLVIVVALVACMPQLPPPPDLAVSSPQRGLVQSEAGQVTVIGIARPGPDGVAVAKVTVNNAPAAVAADGSFSVVVPVPAGAMLLETVAISEDGGKAIDARAVHVGELRPVGTNIDRAVTATLSTDAFARISTAASETLNHADLVALLPPISLGDSLANVELTIGKLTIGNAMIALLPVDGGLQLSVEIGALDVAATAAYAGTLVPDGSTAVKITADKITIAGTLVVTPTGTVGFKTTVASPTVSSTALKLQASGLIGSILGLLQNNLASTVRGITTRSAEAALEPLINKALGALGGPQRLDVLGKTIELQGSASEIRFTSAGALASLNLQAQIGGSESSPGYIFTPNGAPVMDVGRGVQIALSDDLLNDMLAQVHALGVLDLHLQKDFGLFDSADLKLQMPPMISANTGDGKVRLVLGDMIATATDHGKTLVRAAINAQVDVAIGRGGSASEVALQFGQANVFVNLLDDPANPSEIGPDELAGAANAGLGLQLDSLGEVLITVPVPTVAGVSLDNLSLRGDNGYLVASGEIH